MMHAATLTVSDVLQTAIVAFMNAGFEAPETEARALLAGLLNCSRTALLLHRDDLMDADEVETYREWVDRRLKREPVAYIIGHKGFMGFNFEVSPEVLVPRPETELLVEDALMETRDRGLQSAHILDVGTGSGCIAVSLARSLPEANILALDINEKALEIAARNAAKNSVNVRFLKSDLFAELPQIQEGGFDMILGNPPYVASTDLPRLEPELSFEPRLALDGGQDGLDLLRRLVHDSRTFLKPGGLLALEIGHDQGTRVRDLLEANGFENIAILKDYSGHDRIAKGTKRGSV